MDDWDSDICWAWEADEEEWWPVLRWPDNGNPIAVDRQDVKWEILPKAWRFLRVMTDIEWSRLRDATRVW